jgi:DUF1680 family protein
MGMNSTPLPVESVTIEDKFWAPRIRVNRERTIPWIYKQLKETGRLDAFELKWKPGDGAPPHLFWDSDTAKWIEAAAYSVTAYADPELEKRVAAAAALVASAQQPDGYLNTHFTVVEPGKRWTNLRDCHELYCAGHLMEAAAALFQAGGNRVLLDALCRYADHIGKVFGARPGQKRGYPGHEEIELALVKLFRATGKRRYLDLSRYFVDERGRTPHYFDLEAQARGEDPRKFWAGTYAYMQAHVPVREQNTVVGHAVRAMYLYSAMADLAAETGDASLLEACERLWVHVCGRNLYVTGGIGASGRNEGFAADYDLPNETAYAETCAAVGFVFWNHRMLQLTGDARYADEMERSLYNGVLSGVSQDGEKFFYDNPLESGGGHHRQPWFECACCPPNLARLLASIGMYVYSRNENDVAVHLYVQGAGRFQADGQDVTLRQETRYPWDGAVGMRFEMDRPAVFGLRLRIPGWCRQARLLVNGEAVELASRMDHGYARIERSWRHADRVRLELAMPVERMYAQPDASADTGRTALQRGPIVYCLEAADHAVPLTRILLPRGADLIDHYEANLLKGVTVITGEALAADESEWGNALYRTHPPKLKPCRLTAIPYYAWDNRRPGRMRVWIPYIS